MRKVKPKKQRVSSEKDVVKLAQDYMEGRFAIASEHQLLDDIVRLVSPELTHNDVFEVFFEEGVETPEEGVARLQARAATREKKENESA